MLWNCLFVGCGGFVGSVLRYLCTQIKVGAAPLPVITLGINVLGSFAILFLTGIFAKTAPLNSHLMLFARIGLCGGFTTFSTFSAETLGLLESGRPLAGALYAVLSCALCVLAAWAGELAAATVVYQQ